MKREHAVAVKLAYDGSSFFGFQRQPERTTVEGSVISALQSIGAINSAKDSAFRSSSRTDRGVSALGNIVSFRTAFPLNSLCSAVNSELRGVWAYSIAEVKSDFNPRWARSRWYRYHLPKRTQDVDVMKRLASRFEGTHDFSAYARRDDRDPIRTIDSIDIAESGCFILLDFRAESYLWNMVRRIVWVIDASSTGEIDHAALGPEAERSPRRIGLAPPEALVLMDVDCGIDFVVDARAAKAAVAGVEANIVRASMAQEFSKRLLSTLSAGDGCEG
jgi:tRNA pseudouridine38-40 synthase